MGILRGNARPGLFGSNAPLPSAMPATQVQQQRPGLGTRLLGQGWENKVAAIGGMLGGDRQAVARYHAMGQQAQQLAEQRRYEEAQAMRERSLDRQDWQWQQDYARNNPEPTALERNAQAWAQLSPELQTAYGQYAQAGRPDDWVTVPIPGQGTYFGPRSGLAQIYGQGAPSGGLDTLPEGYTVRGGTAGNSGGGFRR